MVFLYFEQNVSVPLQEIPVVPLNLPLIYTKDQRQIHVTALSINPLAAYSQGCAAS